MFKIKINSKIRSYELNEIKNYNKKLTDIYNEGDIVVIDKNVFNLYCKKLKIKNYIVINSNEKEKEYYSVAKLINLILTKKFTKKNKLIAIGGGITQDIVSFISMLLFRGVKWIFFPTTLLAQADSCIGGKVSINFKNLKNQIGFFNPPEKIFHDFQFLNTLTNKEIYSGIGEMMHYYYVSSIKDYNFFVKNIDQLISNNTSALNKIILKTLLIKKKFIERDEFDLDYRLLLNYGHTFGHALESVTNYKIPHGIAISHGMNISNFISYKYKYINKKKFEDMEITLSKIYSYAIPRRIDIREYKEALFKDKKNINNKLRIILTRGPGKMFIKKEVYSFKFEKILKQYFDNYFNK